MMKLDTATKGFDYYTVGKNLEVYGAEKPPLLSMDALKNLYVPVSLFVGAHDLLATKQDVKIIRDMLGEKADYHYEELEAELLKRVSMRICKETPKMETSSASDKITSYSS